MIDIKHMLSTTVKSFLVITPTGYIKHYYAGTEPMKRLFFILFLFIALPHVYSQNEPAAPARDASAPTLNTTAAEIYYFHQDHLGSSAWITDSVGTAIQHLHYLPWGEPFVTQKTGNFNPTYTFSGKERDEETGYSYFGQRFYDSQLSFWLSVDPMRGKYPSLSPFVYCANNPIKLVDPNGMTIEPAGEEEAQLFKNYKRIVNDRKNFWQKRIELREQQRDNAKTKLGRTIRNYQRTQAVRSKSEYVQIEDELNKMEESSIVFRIRMGGNIQVKIKDNSGGNTIYNNSTDEVDINIEHSIFFNSVQIIAHELLHGFQYLNGELDFSSNGLYGGIFYDQTDEYEAYKRGNLFGDFANPTLQVMHNHSNLPSKRKSYNLLTPKEREDYDNKKANGEFR